MNTNKELNDYVLKSGTSIVGIVCRDGVVLGADRRSTAGGQLVMSKKSEKALQVNDYLVVAGAGVASDIDLTQRVLAAELKLKELKSRVRPTVKESAFLLGMMTYRNIRTPSMIPSIVGMLVAGFNEDGKIELFTVEPAGGVNRVDDYDANFGSGMPYMLGFLERQYKKNMSVEDGIKLVAEALKSAMERDTASGNGIDIFTITKDGIKKVVSQEISSEFKDD